MLAERRGPTGGRSYGWSGATPCLSVGLSLDGRSEGGGGVGSARKAGSHRSLKFQLTKLPQGGSIVEPTSRPRWVTQGSLHLRSRGPTVRGGHASAARLGALAG